MFLRSFLVNIRSVWVNGDVYGWMGGWYVITPWNSFGFYVLHSDKFIDKIPHSYNVKRKCFAVFIIFVSLYSRELYSYFLRNGMDFFFFSSILVFICLAS